MAISTLAGHKEYSKRFCRCYISGKEEEEAVVPFWGQLRFLLPLGNPLKCFVCWRYAKCNEEKNSQQG